MSFFIPQQMISLEEKLKNPVWYSLKESHNTFLRTHNDVLFYDPDICIFGAFDDSSKTSLALSEYGKSVEKFFLVSENQTIDIDTKTTVLEKKLFRLSNGIRAPNRHENFGRNCKTYRKAHG